MAQMTSQQVEVCYGDEQPTGLNSPVTKTLSNGYGNSGDLGEYSQKELDALLVHTTRLPSNYTVDSERVALTHLDPSSFHIRPPVAPHLMTPGITPDHELFQTIHMGAARINTDQYTLVITGLVDRPLQLSLAQIKSLPSKTITSFHECYGSPVNPPPKTNPLRIGNVRWTGIPLSLLLQLAKPRIPSLPSNTADSYQNIYVHSDGLDHGIFPPKAEKVTDRYRKDLPFSHALNPESSVLVAYLMNGKPLDTFRGGPVRLVVPGWFGTNSVKWLCRINVAPGRAQGTFTEQFYNEPEPIFANDEAGEGIEVVGFATDKMRPVYRIEPNSCLFVRPATRTANEDSEKECGVIKGPDVHLCGRAWGCVEIVNVDIVVRCLRSNNVLERIKVKPSKRKEFEWQDFETTVALSSGRYEVYCRATDADDVTQPLRGRRNCVHRVEIEVVA